VQRHPHAGLVCAHARGESARGGARQRRREHAAQLAVVSPQQQDIAGRAAPCAVPSAVSVKMSASASSAGADVTLSTLRMAIRARQARQ
jgi:hypothetical protein